MDNPLPIGRFITFEGLDGAGKSTHIERTASLLRAQGHTVTTTREPGGTELGEQIRALLLHRSMHVDTEILLMFAARREHLAQVIEPALARGDWVICDRFTDATFAYQGGGRDVPAARIEPLEAWVQGSRQPDLTFLFDLPYALARQRLGHEGRNLDRFEREHETFHERVRLAYHQRAGQFADRFRVIDASRPLGEIEKLVEEIILAIC